MINKLNVTKLLLIVVFLFIFFFVFWFLILFFIFGIRVLSFEANQALVNDLFYLLSYIFSFVFLSLQCLFWLFINSSISIWVYKDAKKLNVDNPMLWAVLSFMFFPFLAIIYYLVVRKEAKLDSI